MLSLPSVRYSPELLSNGDMGSTMLHLRHDYRVSLSSAIKIQYMYIWHEQTQNVYCKP